MTQMLNVQDTALLIIDVQEKLMAAIDHQAELLASLCRLAAGAQVLELPVVFTEQYPQGLGPTMPELAAFLPGEPVTKLSFSCCREPLFLERLRTTGRRQLLVAGIEAHVCVYQTVMDLLEADYESHLVADGVSSRTAANRELALRRLETAGAHLTSVEMALFELQKVASGDKFKAILEIVK